MNIAGFSEYRDAGQRLAASLDCPFVEIDVHEFPDGEHKLTLPLPVDEHLVVCRSLFDPNAKLVDLMLLAGTARRHGVRHLTLVAPYLCYMRQDIEFHPGEAVSQRIIGRLLAELFDTVITVDPHLHRIPDFAHAVPAKQAIRLTATATMADFLKKRHSEDAVLLGPDAESRQWVAAIAEKTGQAFGVARKERTGDRDIRIEMPELDVKAKRVIIVDDVISTGRTVAMAARLLYQAGAADVECLVTHVLPGAEMEATLRAAGVTTLSSCDSIPHSSNRIELAGLLADAIRDAHGTPSDR